MGIRWVSGGYMGWLRTAGGVLTREFAARPAPAESALPRTVYPMSLTAQAAERLRGNSQSPMADSRSQMGDGKLRSGLIC